MIGAVPGQPDTPPERGRLNSWKEIAAYFGRAERTVRRWEAKEGLPVRRHQHEKRGSVYAYREELDAWREERERLLERVSEEPLQGAATGDGVGRAFWLRVTIPALAAAGFLVWLGMSSWGKGSRGGSVRTGAMVTASMVTVEPFVVDGKAGSSQAGEDFANGLAALLERSHGIRVRRAKDGAGGGGPGIRVEGRVHDGAGRVRVVAKLARGSDGIPLWTGTYETPAGATGAIQQEAARAIGNTVRSQPATFGSRRKPLAAAYAAYMRGVYLLGQGNREAVGRAILEFQDAIRLDGQFAAAHAQLATAFIDQENYAFARAHEVMPKARDAAMRAVALDDDLADGHKALGMVKAKYDWKWEEGCGEISRAVQLNPGDAGIHMARASYCLIPFGRFDEAHMELEAARLLDPASQAISAFEVILAINERRFEEALESCLRIAAVSPEQAWTYRIAAQLYSRKGMHGEARTSLSRMRQPAGGNGRQLSVLAQIYAQLGDQKKAREFVAKLEDQARRDYVLPTDLAAAYAGVADREAALVWLEKAAGERCGSLIHLRTNFVYDNLREDGRFQSLLKRIGMP